VPSGEVHYAYFKKGYPFEIALSLTLCLFDWKFALGNIVGYSFHRYCDNDLDIMGTNNAEGRQVNELFLIGHFMYGISSTYGSIFRRYHRSFITHFPFVSTLIRLIFFFTPVLILGDYWGINFIGNGWHMFWLGFWVGLSQADGIHWFLDKTYGDK
jgi:hypothetical protein